MQAAAQTEEIGNGKEPAVVFLTVAGAFPIDDQPQPETGKQDRVAVDLGFGGVVPLGLRKGESQRGDGGSGDHANIAMITKGLERLATEGSAPERGGGQVDAPYGEG